jgi:hypothetical protein
MIGAIVAVVAVAAIGLVLMVVWPACVVSGRISEAERRQQTVARPGFAQVGAAGRNEPENGSPIDNKRLSLGNRIEDDNAD